MIWVYRPTRTTRPFFSGPTWVDAWYTGAAGAIVVATALWCSLTGVSSMTGGGDIEELDE